MRRLHKCLRRAVVAVLFCAMSSIPLAAFAQGIPGLKINSRATERVQVMKGQSVIVETPQPITQVSLAEPEIADSILLSPYQIYVVGKQAGKTNLTLWDNQRRVSILDIEVQPDIVRLKEKLQEILPLEQELRVSSAHDGVTLYGTISNTANLDKALAIAELYAPQRVVNLVQVAGVHQVMLEVRVAEMSSNLTKRLGINFSAFTDGKFFGLNLINGLLGIDELTIGDVPNLEGVFSSSINAILQFEAGNVTVTGFLDALKEDGLIKILAEPTLVALSGQEASFLAGGEFPIPVPQSDDTVTIQFRTFGVSLSFTPTVLSENKISIQVAPEVSELDFTSAITLTGIRVPALTIRRASTVIELADGQSFAIAGLFQETVREVISKYPILGEIPILGALFRSSSFERGETELIIIVTPRLVKPLDLANQPLPTDGFIEPNDVEFFLFGQLQGKAPPRDRQGKLDGAFGYMANPSGATR